MRERHYVYTDLADHLHVKKQSIANWMQRGAIPYDMALKVSEFLAVPMAAFMQIEELCDAEEV